MVANPPVNNFCRIVSVMPFCPCLPWDGRSSRQAHDLDAPRGRCRTSPSARSMSSSTTSLAPAFAIPLMNRASTCAPKSGVACMSAFGMFSTSDTTRPRSVPSPSSPPSARYDRLHRERRVLRRRHPELRPQIHHRRRSSPGDSSPLCDSVRRVRHRRDRAVYPRISWTFRTSTPLLFLPQPKRQVLTAVRGKARSGSTACPVVPSP